MYDKVIRNARICDGMGTPIDTGEVAINDDRIAAVGKNLGLSKTDIDAEQMVLAPGFIDVHTHYDAQITWDPTTSPSPQMGVTTIVMGNCGFGIAPCRPQDRETMLRTLTKVEGMPYEALKTGVRWNFESFGDYLSAIEHQGIVANIACFAGHSCIRLYVMGEDASKREASNTEIEEMQNLFRESLEAGAIGLGTSTLESHNGHGGIPVPSRFAAFKEFEAFSQVMKETGKGVWQITKGVSPTIEELEQLAESASRPMQICPMLQDPGQPEVVFNDMASISAAQNRGRELYGQVSPFPEILEFNLREPYPMESIQAWRPAMAAQTDEEKISVYRDHNFRNSVKEELKTTGGPFRFSHQWNTMTIVSTKNSSLLGRTVAEIATDLNSHPLDCMLDIGISEKLETQFSCVLFNADVPAVTKLLNDPNSSLGLGDSGAHLTFFCQAGTGLYLLQHYVREEQAISLENAIKMLTSEPAHALRIPDRGRISSGMKADIVLFDPDTVGIGERCWVDDLPGGLSRVHTPSFGVGSVWVNGTQIVSNDKLLPNTTFSGEVIRKFLT